MVASGHSWNWVDSWVQTNINNGSVRYQWSNP